MSAPWRILLGLLAGLLIGLLSPSIGAEWSSNLAAGAKVFGGLWLAGLQMTIVPLVVCMLIVGVNSATNAATSGRVARKAMLWFLLLLTLASSYAALLAPVFLSFFEPSEALINALRAGSTPPAPPSGLLLWLQQLVPTNAIKAAAEGSIVPLVVFALCFAFALNRIEAKRRAMLVEFCQAIADTMIVIVNGVLWLAPIGVACLILPVAAEAGAAVLGALGIYIAMLCCLYLGIIIALYAYVRLGGGETLSRYAPAILPAQMVAASTQSSLASLPAMMDASGKTLGYPANVVGLVLPMAVSLFRITSPVQYMAVATFIAWAFGIDLALAPLILATLLAVVISIGSVGLPGQAIFMGTNLPVTHSLGLPVEPLGLLLAVDLVPDMFATVANVSGDLAVTSRVARTTQPEGGIADLVRDLEPTKR
ncbi:dicarboxylate/amino acid:cation symporter [Ahniella affigens]|uniref:Dicarboxylate/amino acid:cation symporter n=1 Tax=Ahniella affigens TaxID=2021234 RepID=A0A2P1PZ16_9GAMM|nr:dicarboxylate/amino acid:cation symporter [Ahniella affigens]